MVSLTQAQSTTDLEADGWIVLEPSNKQAKGCPILMKRQSDGHLSTFLSCQMVSAARQLLRKFTIGERCLEKWLSQAVITEARKTTSTAHFY